MKTLFLSLFCFLSLCLFSSTSAQSDTITILHVNDTHSFLSPLAPRTQDLQGTHGGIARAATVIGRTKMNEANVLTLHGGDAMMGDLFFNQYFGIAEFKLMNALQFDAMAVGNHEFDLGPDMLKMAFDSSLAGGGFSVISSNLILEDPAVQALKNYIKPYIVKQVGSLKVGLFSLLTPETNMLSQPLPAVIDTSIESVINSSLTALMTEGCDLIVCLSHLGLYYDQQIAAASPYINVIISSHDHLKTEQPVDVINPLGQHVYIVQANSAYQDIGKLKLAVNAGKVSVVDYQLIALDQTIPEEPGIAAEVNNLIAEIESVYGQLYTTQCGYAAEYFDEVVDVSNYEGSKDTPIGNLVTDAFRWKTNTDIAITTGGSTSQPIYAGPIVPADLFRVFGYGFNTVNGLGFRLATFDILGSRLWEAIEAVLSIVAVNDEFLPQVSGMNYSADLNLPPGARLRWITINDTPIDLGKTYSLTVNEFVLLAFKDLFGIPIMNEKIFDENLTEFHALLDYVIFKGGTISPESSGRISLPVELSSFSAVLTGEGIQLSWQTASEKNNKGFEIQRNCNTGWETISFINGQGTTAQINSYSYTDKLKNISSSGIIRYRLRQIDFDGTVEISNEVIVTLTPQSFSLEQNYPNPFNPLTTISYSLPLQSKVTIQIFNVVGELVEELYSGTMEAGYHQAKFNAINIPSGVYLYKVAASSLTDGKKFNAVKKMIIMK